MDNKKIKKKIILIVIISIILGIIGIILFLIPFLSVVFSIIIPEKSVIGDNYSTVFVSRPIFSPDDKKIAYIEYNFLVKTAGQPGHFDFDNPSPRMTYLIPVEYNAKLKILNIEESKIEKEIDISSAYNNLDGLVNGLGLGVQDCDNNAAYSNNSLQWKDNIILSSGFTSCRNFYPNSPRNVDYNFYINTHNWSINKIGEEVFSYSYSNHKKFFLENGTKIILVNVGGMGFNDVKSIEVSEFDFISNKISSLNKFLIIQNDNNNEQKALQFCGVDDLYKNNKNYIVIIKCSDYVEAYNVKKFNGIYELISGRKFFNNNQYAQYDGDAVKIADIDSNNFSFIENGFYRPIWSKLNWYKNYKYGSFSSDGKLFAYPEQNDFSVSTKYGAKQVSRSNIKIIKVE